jgi:hypothetical protein
VPKVGHRPTLPFSREEMLKILAAFEAYGKSAGLAKRPAFESLCSSASVQWHANRRLCQMYSRIGSVHFRKSFPIGLFDATSAKSAFFVRVG